MVGTMEIQMRTDFNVEELIIGVGSVRKKNAVVHGVEVVGMSSELVIARKMEHHEEGSQVV